MKTPIKRRKAIKLLAQLSCGLLASRLLPAVGASEKPLYGINAPFLLVESYRQTRKNPHINVRKTIFNYLQDDLKLARLREKSKVNAIRFWAFNNYPPEDKRVLKGTFDAALWPTGVQLNQQALEILEVMMQCLSDIGFSLVPVLSNYWIEYGGILRYLEWTGRLTKDNWFDAFCNKKDEDYYLKYAMDFYTIPEVEILFNKHINPVVDFLRNNPQVLIVDVMNEPRGKSNYSVSNQIVRDGFYSHQIVAQWLNRQAAFVRKKLPETVMVTSGEEGWLVSPVNLSLNYIKNESQYYEGIDLKTNLYDQNSALTMGSVHMYTHEAVELPRANGCNQQYIDRRGWDYLLQPNQPRNPESYIKLGEEWLSSRATAIGDKPWYVGEMGWCQSQSPKNRSPLSATALQSERIKIYRHWTEQAFDLGARGVFLWGLNGLENRDEFYGLNSTQVMEIYPNKL